jgi:NAD(P)H-hydrate epimerase
MTLPRHLYTAADVRKLDALAVNSGIDGYELMCRAGQAAFDHLRARWPRAERLLVLCGPGNNGGDGYVLARLARAAGRSPVVCAVGPEPSGGAATRARTDALSAGVTLAAWDPAHLPWADVVVDALFGTGLQRAPKGEAAEMIRAVNASGRPVIALDVPSGLDADTGAVHGIAIRADLTVTFIGLKTGLFTGAGREQAGIVHFASLGIPESLYESVQPVARRLVSEDLIVPRRPRDAHKGMAGRLLIIGGDRGMPGAVRLAGEAAYRCGAGLVTLATHPAHAATVNIARPELIAHGVKGAAGLKPLLTAADVVALGPGLGRQAWGRALFQAAARADRPMVIDADGLFFLAKTRLKRRDWVLTPHPGEAARLLGVTTAEIQQDRLAAVRAVARRYGGVCVLKGSGTLIAGSDDPILDLCDLGNPGLASGGTGDVLTGAIAAFLGQGLPARATARLGVWLHSRAADRLAAGQGEIGLMAGDLPPALRAELNRLVNGDARD